MKSTQKGKLSLNKKAIAQLDNTKMRSIAAGQEEAAPEFTSIFHCSKGGFTCQCQTLACNFTDHCQITVA